MLCKGQEKKFVCTLKNIKIRPDSLIKSVVFRKRCKDVGATPNDGTNKKARYFKMYEDKKLVCKDCGKEFVFTAGEQEFFAEKNLVHEPQRCKPCRNARKNASRTERVMYTGVCATCGKEAKVPFEPKNGKPVYCDECFSRLNKD